MTVKCVLIGLLCVSVSDAQLLNNLQSWWSSSYDKVDNIYKSYTSQQSSFSNAAVQESVSVVKYGEWTSAPQQTTQNYVSYTIFR